MEAVHTRRDTQIALTLGHIARTVLVHAYDAATNTRAFLSGLFPSHPLPGISAVGDSGLTRKGNQPALTVSGLTRCISRHGVHSNRVHVCACVR